MPNASKGGCALGVTFDFPIHRPHVAPAFNEGEWVAVPPIMEKLRAAKALPPRSVSSSGEEFLRFVHLVDGHIYACTRLTAVEFTVGQIGLPGIALTPDDIAVLLAFRQEVTHISISEGRVVFRFPSGEKYEAALISYPADRWRRKFDEYWRMGNDLFDAAACKKEFIDSFSPSASLIEVHPHGFVGYSADTPGYKSILKADTRATETLFFGAYELLCAVKLADKIDFTGGDATFTMPEGRGLASSLTMRASE